MNVSFHELIGTQPPEYTHDVNMHGACLENTFVILDDDPTGCQTVHDVPVLFSWETSILEKVLGEQPHLLFILTNTRSMPEHAAKEVIGEVMRNLVKAAKAAGRKFIVISRSDSTLLGHYPAELDAIEEHLEGGPYMHCLIPAFFPGGRYTCNNIHYVREGGMLVPAAATPFAEDSVFGYAHSELPAYIEEKTGNAISSSEVLTFSVEELRKGGPDHVREKLRSSNSRACVVNALAQTDLDVFAAGAWEAILTGKRILFRTGASFINSFGCIPVKEPLGRSALRSNSDKGGLIVVGSHLRKSSDQLLPLIESAHLIPLELHVQELLAGLEKEIVNSFAERTDKLISKGRHVLIYTSRELIQSGDPNRNIEIRKIVSKALVEIVKGIKTTPSFLVAKGGITSYDIASQALQFRRATVIGQALPGVPVIVPDERPLMKYVTFPGTVGDQQDLLNLFKILTD